MKHLQKSSGFTLIELMVVLVILSIVTVYAYTSYRKSIVESRRAEAHKELLALQLDQERFRSQNPAFANMTVLCTNATTACGSAAAITAFMKGTYDASGYYDVTIQSANATTYVLRAVPTTKGKQNKDTNCAQIELNNNSDKTPAACW